MWLQDHITVGTLVERADNPNHHGEVVAVFGFQAPESHRAQAAAASVYRVKWQNGWKEDCDRAEINRRF